MFTTIYEKINSFCHNLIKLYKLININFLNSEHQNFYITMKTLKIEHTFALKVSATTLTFNINILPFVNKR